MLKVFVLSFLITFLYTPFGYLLQKGNSLRSFSLQLIFGLIILSFISLSINFFSPVNELLSSLILIFSFFIIIKYRATFLSKKYLIFCFISSIIIFLLITISDVYRPDAGLYHLPYIGILNNEKIIFGLSNLHFRFGHISIIQYTSAISNNFIFRENGIVFPSALIASSVIINFLSNANRNFKKDKFNFHFFLINFFLIFIFYKANRYGEYGNDTPAHLLMFLLISEIIKNINKVSSEKFFNLVLISIFIIMNKIILLLSIFYPLVFFFSNKLKLKIFNFKNIFILLFVFIWFVKNIIVSGCLLYPVGITCINNLKWVDEKEAKMVSIENEAWAKGWPDYKRNNSNFSQEEYSKKFNWFETWSKNHLKKIIKIFLPYLILIIILPLILSKKTNLPKYNREFNYLLILTLAGCLMWFLKVPVFRYGYSYLIIFISLIIGWIYSFFIYKQNLKIVFKVSIVILFTVFSAKNLNRIIFENKNYYNYPWPKYHSMGGKNKIIEHEFKFINGKKIYYPVDEYCMFKFVPCGKINDNLKHKKLFTFSMLYK